MKDVLGVVQHRCEHTVVVKREMYFSIEMDLCSTCKVDLGSIAQIELDHSSILTRKFRLVRTRYLFFAPCLHPRK